MTQEQIDKITDKLIEKVLQKLDAGDDTSAVHEDIRIIHRLVMMGKVIKEN
jgi:hypothetical protein